MPWAFEEVDARLRDVNERLDIEYAKNRGASHVAASLRNQQTALSQLWWELRPNQNGRSA